MLFRERSVGRAHVVSNEKQRAYILFCQEHCLNELSYLFHCSEYSWSKLLTQARLGSSQADSKMEDPVQQRVIFDGCLLQLSKITLKNSFVKDCLKITYDLKYDLIQNLFLVEINY